MSDQPVTLYVVTGSSGEYSDRFEWVESVWTAEAAAQAEVDRLSAISRVKQIERWSMPGCRYGSNPEGLPDDHLDTSYSVSPAPLDASAKPEGS